MGAEEINDPVESLLINRDQADCLLIVLEQQMRMLTYGLQEQEKMKPAHIEYMTAQMGFSLEEAEEKYAEKIALDQSILDTIPSILSEIKEIYPMLIERNGPIIPRPSWSTKS